MSNKNEEIYQIGPFMWALFAVLAVLLYLPFRAGLTNMIGSWGTKEYSHGYLIPFIAAFFIWQKKDILERIRFDGSWLGLLVIATGVGMYAAGTLSTLYIVLQYSFIVVLAGTILTLTGWTAFKKILVPLAVLLFMIPLPNFFLFNLSQQLQLISSGIGVWVIRLFGIPVFLEGNVIDLGVFKLQVVQACSGLRYLFPLMTLGFIAAYLFKGAFWKRVVIFLSSIPITVFMNSFRIGMIGVLVNYWGISMAQGFLHYFEGWVIFMVCTGALVAEMWILAKIGGSKLSLHEAFGLEFPAPHPADAIVRKRRIPRSLVAAGLLLAAVTVLNLLLPQRVEVVPQRKEFALFPMNIGNWNGKFEPLDPIYVAALNFTDYIMADYANDRHDDVNFYVAYYASQRAGDSAHSPRSCIPGGGWVIKSLTQLTISGVDVDGQPLRVNRVVIQMGDVKQLVYYWFQEQGRLLTNEYLVKWFLFWDALTRNRTDGALVRLVTYVPPGQDLATADKRLTAFVRTVSSRLAPYVPE